MSNPVDKVKDFRLDLVFDRIKVTLKICLIGILLRVGVV